MLLRMRVIFTAAELGVLLPVGLRRRSGPIGAKRDAGEAAGPRCPVSSRTSSCVTLMRIDNTVFPP